jgi:hypothetical protein
MPRMKVGLAFHRRSKVFMDAWLDSYAGVHGGRRSSQGYFARAAERLVLKYTMFEIKILRGEKQSSRPNYLLGIHSTLQDGSRNRRPLKYRAFSLCIAVRFYVIYLSAGLCKIVLGDSQLMIRQHLMYVCTMALLSSCHVPIAVPILMLQCITKATWSNIVRLTGG